MLTSNSLFSHVTMKALVQSVRYNVFTIIDTLMAKHREGRPLLSSTNSYLIDYRHPLDLKAINNEFLDGYIRLADGEKDPRNLLVAFAIARVILIEFDITPFVEVNSPISPVEIMGIQTNRPFTSACSR